MPDTAKLFMHGRSKAVRLPKQYRLPGKEVIVSRDGEKVILQPLEPPPFDVQQWRAELDALGAGEFLLDGVSTDDLLPAADITID